MTTAKATEQDPHYIALPASADLSAYQYRFMTNTSGQAALPTLGGAVIGVQTNKPSAADQPSTIQYSGIALVMSAASITAGGKVSSDTAGKVVAQTGSYLTAGWAMNSCSSGEYCAVLLANQAGVATTTSSETKTSGALTLGVPTSFVSVTGTVAFTLAAPTYEGQTKDVVCTVAATVPAGTLTVSSPDDTTGFVCPATFFFDNVGQTLRFEATAGLKWRCVKKIRTGVKTLTIGTTTTTGIADMSHIDVAVTATVASTTTKALPNGAAVGELCSVTCSTAASTPHGDLGGTFMKKDGTAGTLLDDFTLVTDNALLQWTGAAWKAVVLAGTTLSIA